jgi:hypothetical protein
MDEALKEERGALISLIIMDEALKRSTPHSALIQP